MLDLCVTAIVLIAACAAIGRVSRWYQNRPATRLRNLGIKLNVAEAMDIEAMLIAAEADELDQQHQTVNRYVGGVQVGYIVRIDDHSSGFALHLSDGHHLALRGVAHRSRRLVAARAAGDLLRPTVVEQDGMSYRVRFCGHEGQDVDLYARQVMLTGDRAA